MCLMMTFRIPAERSPSGEFAVGPLAVHVGHRWPWTREVALTVSDGTSCACSLLAEDADWNAATWSLRPEMCDPLARTVQAVGEALLTDFTFEALWVSDQVEKTVEIDLNSLVELTRRDELGTRTRYVVNHAVAA
jgi:hypothetical protein